jgi:hypothetical protein
VDDNQNRERVGSVAEETARLIDAIGGWAQDVASDHARAGSRSGGYASGAAPSEDDAPPPRSTRPGQSRCEHCGADSRMGEAVTCQLCPVCQGISVLRAVRPETVDRLADLAAGVARTLRDLAAERRGFEGAAPRPPAGGPRVHDISVDDEDAAGAGGGDANGTPGRSQTAKPGSTAT